MKKLYFLFFIILSFKSYGQTYTIKVSYDASSDGCHAAGFRWNLKGDASTIDSFSSGGNSMDVNDVKTYPNVANFSTFTLSSGSNCTPLDSSPPCTSSGSESSTNVKMIQGNYLGFGGCNGGVSITSFKPNVTIQNLDTANPNEICAGFQLGLAGFPAGFPDVAYHWQYSLDNISWTEVPNLIRGNKSNDIDKTKFTIQEILGDNHTNYFNKLIYFRLGYGQNRGFTNSLPIKYSPCAPIITDITYEGPKCNEDAIKKVDITFNRPLDSGESLDRIKMKNISNGSERNERTDISVFSTSNPNIYSFTNIDALENGQSYKIVYQAQMIDPSDSTKKILKGFMESPTPLNFTYIAPVKIQFEITNYTEPSCKGGTDGIIEIKVLSGVSPYHFYKDGVEIIPAPTLQNGKYYITGLGAKTYNIMVTDGKGCIEKI